MAGCVIDSQRHAAFQLGYLGRRLSIRHDARGFEDDPDEIDELIGGLDGPAFVLLADDPANYRCYKEQLAGIAGLHEMQVDQFDRGMRLATAPGAPMTTWLLLGRALERLGVLRRRALRGDGQLEAWFAVGGELAELTLRLRARLGDETAAEPSCDPLIGAVGRLSSWDRMMVRDFLDIRCDSLEVLVKCLDDAYGIISDYAARPERDRSSPGAGSGDRRDAAPGGRAERETGEPPHLRPPGGDALAAFLRDLKVRLEPLLVSNGTTAAATDGGGSGGRGGRDPLSPEGLDDFQAAAFGSLNRSLKTALLQYHSAARELGRERLTDQEAYDHLKGQGIALGGFDNWRRYLSSARKALGLNKNRPRRGRKGRSIVGQGEI